MKNFRPLLLVAVGLIQLPGRAEELPASTPPTNGVVITSDLINGLLNEAQTNNPGQLAADSRVKAASANVESVRTWEDPRFKFGGSVFSSRGMSPAQWGDLSYGIQEKLPLWGMPKLNREAASAALGVSRTEAQYRLEKLRRNITQALVSAALARRVVEIDEQDLAWLQTTALSVEAKYRNGKADAGDVLEVQNAASARKDQLRTDRLEVSHDQFVLNRLLNRETDSPWPPLDLPSIAPSVPYSSRLLSLALSHEPELKVMEQEIQHAKAEAELANRSRLPDISVDVSGWQYHGDGGFRMGTFGLSFPLPWGNAGKYRADYERAKETEKAAQQERENQTLAVRDKLDRLTVDLDAARRQALLYQNEISVRAGQALVDKLSSWQSGRVTLREVLDARRDALNAELMAARATAGQYQTLAELLLWTGQDTFKSVTSLANEPATPASKENAPK